MKYVFSEMVFLYLGMSGHEVTDLKSAFSDRSREKKWTLGGSASLLSLQAWLAPSSVAFGWTKLKPTSKCWESNRWVDSPLLSLSLFSSRWGSDTTLCLLLVGSSSPCRSCFLFMRCLSGLCLFIQVQNAAVLVTFLALCFFFKGHDCVVTAVSATFSIPFLCLCDVNLPLKYICAHVKGVLNAGLPWCYMFLYFLFTHSLPPGFVFKSRYSNYPHMCFLVHPLR